MLLILEYINVAETKKPPEVVAFEKVVMDGIEPPTQGFSVLCSTD